MLDEFVLFPFVIFCFIYIVALVMNFYRLHMFLVSIFPTGIFCFTLDAAQGFDVHLHTFFSAHATVIIIIYNQ